MEETPLQLAHDKVDDLKRKVTAASQLVRDTSDAWDDVMWELYIAKRELLLLTEADKPATVLHSPKKGD